jgi:exonuclease V
LYGVCLSRFQCYLQHLQDEISRKPISSTESGECGNKRMLTSAPSTPRKPKRTRSNQSPTLQALCGRSHDTVSTIAISPLAPPSHVLHLFDNKTRYLKSLPSCRDTHPSRLQLALYHRLLQDLIPSSSQETLDLSEFWNKVEVNSLKPFSRQFCDQSGLPLRTEAADGKQTEQAWCLNDLVNIWQGLVSTLGVNGVDKGLTLVYRTRKLYKSRKGSPRIGIRRSDLHSVGQSADEEIQVAQAIKASLLDVAIVNDAVLAQALAESLQQVQTVESGFSGTNEVGTSDAGTLDDQPSKSTDTGLLSARQQETSSNDSEEEKEGDSSIIGEKVFDVDEILLDSHLDRVFDWWHGKRPPEGVEIEDSGRCRYDVRAQFCILCAQCSHDIQDL